MEYDEAFYKVNIVVYKIEATTPAALSYNGLEDYFNDTRVISAIYIDIQELHDENLKAFVSDILIKLCAGEGTIILLNFYNSQTI